MAGGMTMDAIPFSAYHTESVFYPAQESEILRLED
jgi:hypothetical protein